LVGKPLTGHTKWIRSMAWEPYHLQKAGRPRLASASKDATVRIWAPRSHPPTDMVLTGHKDSVSCVRWGGQGRIYTSSDDSTIKIWDAMNGTLIKTLTLHALRVNYLSLSTDFVLRTAYHDHTGKAPTTDAERISKAKERFEKAATVNGAVVERLVSASDDGTIGLWDLSPSIKHIGRLTGHQKLVNRVSFSPDGLYIASAGFDNHVLLWNTDGKFLYRLRAHVAPVYQIAFSADSRLLVSASKDTTLKVWDCKTGKLKEDLPGHKDEVYAADWAPDGNKVGSGGKDKMVRLWSH